MTSQRGTVDWDGDVPVLMGVRCQDCGEHLLADASSCRRCGSAELVAEELPGRGSVWSFTIQHVAPKPPFLPDHADTAGTADATRYQPLVVGYVDLGVLKLATRLIGEPEGGWRIGTSVRLAAHRIAKPGGTWVHRFEPDPQAVSR